jgi:hypothetical protein
VLEYVRKTDWRRGSKYDVSAGNIGLGMSPTLMLGYGPCQHIFSILDSRSSHPVSRHVPRTSSFYSGTYLAVKFHAGSHGIT